VVVDAHTVGSCPAGWHDLHPWLAHYRRGTGAARARLPGRRASGTRQADAPAGWEQWSLDLSRYAGKQVEISISYASATPEARNAVIGRAVGYLLR
jgi:hypothetical protein